MGLSSPRAGHAQIARSRRDILLSVAGDLISTSGYSRTSLRDVADAAGIQAGSIYHHFASKEMLAVELVAAFHAEIDAVAKAAADLALPSVDPVQALRDFAQRVAAVVERHPAAVHLCVYDAPSSAGEALTRIVREQPADLDARWGSLLQSAARQGRLHPDADPVLLRFVLQDAVIGLGQLPGTHSLRDLVGSLTSVLLDGLAPNAPTDAELDATAAAQAARDAAQGWAGSEPQGSPRRNQILTAARQEFARRGYEATTVRDIADAAGLRASSMYRHFDSKQAMLLAIIGNFSHKLLAAYKAIVEAGGSPVETLDALLRLMGAATEHFQPEFVIIRAWWRILDADPESDPILAENEQRLRILHTVVQRGVAAGQFRSTPHPGLLPLALRDVMWIRLQDARDVTDARAVSVDERLAFLRRCLLRGATVPGPTRFGLDV